MTPSLTFAATKYLDAKSDEILKKIKMPLTKEKKATTFAQFAGNEKNTGSIEGQIALLTERISQIAGHLQDNKKDFSTHRGLMQLVGKRKRLLNYLQKHDLTGYRQLIEKLGLRK
jgi:small subunit ribosomal protein S15